MAFAETQILTAELRLNDKLTSGLNKAKGAIGGLGTTTSKVLGTLGSVLGAGMGIAASGAAELNQMTAEFTAQTGLAGTAAQSFASNLSGLYRTNVQGYEEISGLLIGLQQHMDLTGQTAKNAAASFLDFARVAGVDATTAVGNFDELIDAGVITVDQMTSMMDKLTVSHQKYGVGVQATIDALVKFAPAMEAAGMSTDDALGLINMFTESGLNAEASTKAFNIALGKVKSPEELRRLIAQITATEDPFQRAQLAADLFGKRAGVQLANALKPGTGGIEAWSVSVAESAGATKKAGDALDSSFGTQFQLLVKNAAGALAEFGTSFGPLLYVAAAFGPKFTAAIGAGLGGLAGMIVPRILGAITGATVPAAVAGEAVGMATSGGVATGIMAGGVGVKAALLGLAKLALPITIPVVVTVVVAEWMKGEEAATLAAKTTKELEDFRDEVQAKLDASRGDFFFNLFGPKHEIEHALDAVNAELARRGQETGAAFAGSFASGIVDSTSSTIRNAMDDVSGEIESLMAKSAAGVKITIPAVKMSPEDVVKTFRHSLGGVIKAFSQTGADGMLALAAAITADRQKPLDAFDTLKQMLKHQMSRTAEGAHLAGELTSKALAEGLRSRDPAVRAQAEATKQLILDRLTFLTIGTQGIGKAAMAELKRGMKSKDPDIRAASRAAYEAAMSKLKALKEPAGTAGTDAGAAFAAGIVSSAMPWITALGTGLQTGIDKLREFLGISPAQPPVKPTQTTGAWTPMGPAKQAPSASDKTAKATNQLVAKSVEATKDLNAKTRRELAQVNSSIGTGTSATRGVISAINAKDWSPDITIPVTVNTRLTVTVRAITKATTVTGRYGSTHKVAPNGIGPP